MLFNKIVNYEVNVHSESILILAKVETRKSQAHNTYIKPYYQYSKC